MQGFLNINKPKGITSFGVIEVLRNVLGVKKLGHAGNLDPHATGVLVVGIGKATRFLPYIMDLEKEYLAKVKLGILTDTLDETGEILDRKEVPTLSREELEGVLKEFVGDVMQTPPPFSAVKVKGERLYDLAREGVLVSPKPKKVKIKHISLEEFGEDYIIIKVQCGKGTYIRSLARDIAEKLETYGIVSELTRMRVGHFKIEDSVRLDVPQIAVKVIKIEDGLCHLPRIFLREKSVSYFKNGNRVGTSGIAQKDREAKSFILCRVFSPWGDFLGIGILKWDGVHPKRLLPAH